MRGGGVVSFSLKSAAEVAAMRQEVARKPDAHLVLEFIDSMIPATLDPLLGDICGVLGAYFLAVVTS